ncbi:MAG: endonuclease/exonuclease/phosphatase family protein [Bacteroidales bacterium]|nr:endonuclease/exonuclease/phosphatase family protein [Bacteroidales bacterium]
MTTSPPRPRYRWFRNLFLVLNIFSAFLLVISYATPFVNPARFWPLAFAGLAVPYLMLIQIMFLAIWLLMWKRLAILPLATLLLGFNHIGRIVQFHSGQNFPDQEDIRITSFNIRNFAHKIHDGKPAEQEKLMRKEISEFLAERKGTLVCLQEYFCKREELPVSLRKFATGIQMPYFCFQKYYETSRFPDALVIMSRYPIISQGSIESEGKTICLFADLDMGDDTIRVFNVHLASIHFIREDYLFFDELLDGGSETIREGTRKILAKLKRAFVRRGNQVGIVHAAIQDSPHPVVVCGDLNDTPHSYAYRVVKGRLEDTFLKAGRGISNTYAGEQIPSYRIDYIFYDPCFFSTTCYQRFNVKLSDHYPISCDLRKTQDHTDCE